MKYNCLLTVKFMSIHSKNMQNFLSDKSKQQVYLDYNAMAAVRPEILNILQDLFGLYGNPFAAHCFGRNMKGLLEFSRGRLAQHLMCEANEVIFTSGGTEANNLGILGVKHIVKNYIFGSTEHESVPNVIPSHSVVIVKMGEIDLMQLEQLLIEKSPAFVSVMLVNNETGIITRNIKEAAELTRKYGGIFHTDAVQAVGRMNISFADLGVDMMSISSLKSGGVIGSGALIKRREVDCRQIMYGRTIEGGIRPGTQAVPLIAAFVESVMIAAEKMDSETKNLLDLKSYLESSIVSAGGFILGSDIPRTANTSYIIMGSDAVDQSEQVMRFDMAGIAVSAGSACYKTRFFSDEFLKSIGVSESEYRSGVRVSMGFSTTREDLDKFIDLWKKIKIGE